MVLAWSVTEIIRYSFYACNLLGKNPYVLLYLRYTTFYILYPLGASSEAFLTYATLPASSPVSGWRLAGTWKLTDYARAVLFSIWWPGNLFLLFVHTPLSHDRRLFRIVHYVHIYDCSATKSDWKSAEEPQNTLITFQPRRILLIYGTSNGTE